jgi:hypothetical protein
MQAAVLPHVAQHVSDKFAVMTAILCRKFLQQQEEAVSAEVHERREGVEDLTEVLKCVKDQAAAAAGSKEQLKVRLIMHGVGQPCRP